MALNWLGKTSAVRQFVAAVQAAASAAVDASEGSITLALGQAATGAFLWLQALVAKVLLLTRAATSKGSDLDTWMADYFFTRLPAVPAVGQVTFSRLTPTLQAVVPIGQGIATGPGGIQYIVTTELTNSAYSSALGGYVLAPATASVTVPIQAVSAGSAGNVLANTITSFVSPISGVDAVTNASALATGLDAESDPAFIVRFALYILGLRRATVSAIEGAVLSTRQGLTCIVLENKDTDCTTTDNGFVTVIVDDGTGTPSATTINNASLAVDAVRAAGVRFGVIGPTIQTNVIVLTVVSLNSGGHAADILAAAAAITAYVNGLPAGGALIWARLYQVAFDSSSNIIDITGLLVNGSNVDVTAALPHINKIASVTVS